MLATETFAKLYYGYMDALISSMQTSIASGSVLAHTRPSMDFNSLNQESGLLEFGKLSLQDGNDVFYGHNLTVTHVDTSHKFSPVFRRSHSTVKSTKIIPPQKIKTLFGTTRVVTKDFRTLHGKH